MKTLLLVVMLGVAGAASAQTKLVDRWVARGPDTHVRIYEVPESLDVALRVDMTDSTVVTARGKRRSSPRTFDVVLDSVCVARTDVYITYEEDEAGERTANATWFMLATTEHTNGIIDPRWTELFVVRDERGDPYVTVPALNAAGIAALHAEAQNYRTGKLPAYKDSVRAVEAAKKAALVPSR